MITGGPVTVPISFPFVKSAAGDAEQLRGFLHRGGLGQHAPDVFVLDLFQRVSCRYARCRQVGRRRSGSVGRQIVKGDLGLAAKITACSTTLRNSRRLPGQHTCFDGACAAGSKTSDAFAALGAEKFGITAAICFRSRGSFAQRRHADGDHVQAVEQVFAESFRARQLRDCDWWRR